MICIRLQRHDGDHLVDCADLKIPCEQSPGLMRGPGWHRCLCWRGQDDGRVYCQLAPTGDEPQS
jgi:hypothetical protein